MSIQWAAYFPSYNHAVKYYGRQLLNAEAVNEKLASGEIFLGKPKTKQGQKLVLLDSGLRYGIKS